MPFVPTCLSCLRALRAYVPMCLKLVRVYVPPCLRALIFHVTTCLHVPTCLRAYNYSQNILRLTSVPCIAVFLWIICRGSHRRCSLRKGVLRNFAKFTGNHLYQSLFFNKVAGLRPATLLKRNSGTGLFL